MSLPPLPSWYGLHPLVVHFPVALLLVAPALLAIALLARDRARTWSFAALVLIALGTIAAFVAVECGEAAAEVADRTPEINRVLAEHAELAEATRNVFAALTVVLAALLFAPVALRRPLSPRAFRIASAGFLVVYLGCCLLVANTAHLGGRLVHQYGVRSVITGD